MKKEKKVMIHSVLTALQKRDPEWENPKMLRQFKLLYQGWRQAELRAKRHTGFFYSNSWQRGWLPQADFIRFRDYALQ